MARTVTGGWTTGQAVILLLLTGCGKNLNGEPMPVAPSPSDARVAAPKPHAEALADCVAGCERKNMARAVDMALITEECTAWCDGTPVLTEGVDLDLLVGLPVRVVGTPMIESSSSKGGIGTSLRMGDGAKVWITREPATEAWSALSDGPWAITGILRREEPPVNYWLEGPSTPETPPEPTLGIEVLPG